jgi:hypothetical protein
MRREMASRYAIGATFINQRNPRSFAAHTRKAGLVSLTSFSFNQNHYHALAFATHENEPVTAGIEHEVMMQ